MQSFIDLAGYQLTSSRIGAWTWQDINKTWRASTIPSWKNSSRSKRTPPQKHQSNQMETGKVLRNSRNPWMLYQQDNKEQYIKPTKIKFDNKGQSKLKLLHYWQSIWFLLWKFNTTEKVRILHSLLLMEEDENVGDTKADQVRSITVKHMIP